MNAERPAHKRHQRRIVSGQVTLGHVAQSGVILRSNQRGSQQTRRDEQSNGDGFECGSQVRLYDFRYILITKSAKGVPLIISCLCYTQLAYIAERVQLS